MIVPPDGLLRIAVIAFGAAIIRAGFGFYWKRSKSRRREVPLKLRKGVHVPWGNHEKAEWHFGTIGLVWLIVVGGFAIYLIATGQ